ncbi:hypothetical protein [Actinophytocola sp. NPDC049390]|uniref:deoxynucleotide monophosphate kinase family protein n=1 Tax=Actinophytocola sp. NPDC049390 TaxID=3363894 RepID=UPI0037AC81DA
MKIVGLTGKKRSGKDTAATALVEQRGFVRVGFADAVKDLALRVNPQILNAPGPYGRLSWAVKHYGWEMTKNTPEVRRFLQELGIGVRDIEDDFWLSAWTRALVRKHPQAQHVVVPDVRFANEAEALRSDFWVRGDALLIRIERPDLADDGDRHVSETEMDRIEPDLTIVNDGTAADLRAKVLAAYDEWVGA